MTPRYASEDSRALNAAHPELQRAWEWLRHAYRQRYGEGVPQPFVICTTRGKTSQANAKAGGYSQLSYGHSKHNVVPSLALDIAMDDVPSDGVGNQAAWHGREVARAYRRFGELAESIGLEWLDEIGDYGHIELRTELAAYLAGEPVTPLVLPAQAEDKAALERDFSGETVVIALDTGALAEALGRIADAIERIENTLGG